MTLIPPRPLTHADRLGRIWNITADAMNENDGSSDGFDRVCLTHNLCPHCYANVILKLERDYSDEFLAGLSNGVFLGMRLLLEPHLPNEVAHEHAE